MTAGTRRSARFVTWARAWRAGTVSYDDVADETEGDEEHLVADAPGTWTDIPLREAVQGAVEAAPGRDPAGAAGAGRPARLARAGSVHRAALEAGEGVVAGRLGSGAARCAPTPPARATPSRSWCGRRIPLPEALGWPWTSPSAGRGRGGPVGRAGRGDRRR